MNKSFKRFFRGEIEKILIGLLFTAIAFLVLAAVRIFSTNLFLFLQIVIVSLLLLLFAYFLSRKSTFAKWLLGSEIYVTIFAFTLTSFLLLNVDRSRSVYVLKWIDVQRVEGISFEELLEIGKKEAMNRSSLKQRLEEQIQSGNVYREDNGFYRTTLRGHALNSFFALVAEIQHLEGYKKS